MGRLRGEPNLPCRDGPAAIDLLASGWGTSLGTDGNLGRYRMRDPNDELNALKERNLHREITNVVESAQGARVRVDGRELMNFSSNDYLGLADSEPLKHVFTEAVGRFGVGSGASRLVCFTSS